MQHRRVVSLGRRMRRTKDESSNVPFHRVIATLAFYDRSQSNRQRPLGIGPLRCEIKRIVWTYAMAAITGRQKQRRRRRQGLRGEMASCHGATGQGGSADRLVDRETGKNWDFATNPKLVKTVGNYWPYATTLYDYTQRAMPFMQPGTLTPDETYSLVAYILALNKIVPDDAVMDAKTLPAVRMPARDRFVIDNRAGGKVVK